MYSWNEKHNEWWDKGLFETIEECIDDAKNEGFKEGEAIKVGVVKPYKIKVDAEEILEKLEAEAYEQCWEVAEGWNPAAEKEEDIEKLSKAITDLTNQWLETHEIKPGFYVVNDIRDVFIQ